jgi:HD-GYP domain-containing protein (c-di-GMP phosphodiesterase class II)
VSLARSRPAATLVVLLLPLVALAVLLLRRDLDVAVMAPGPHFYIVSGTALASAFACAVVISLTRSLRETRLLFLGLAFMSIAAVFSVHGLGTPGHIHDEVYAELIVSSWLSVFAGAVFVALSVLALPDRAEAWLKRQGGAAIAAVALALGAYVGLSIAAPDWLAWLPFRDRPLQLAFSALTLGLLGVSAWRYAEAFLFARLPSQWVMVCALLLLAEVQVCLAFGTVWHLSWWLYHVLYAVAFLVLFAGWAMEARRAGSVRVIAEALSMRDAVAQLNRGYERPIADLIDAIEWKDLYTLGHVRRVATYALMIGQEMGLSPLELRSLALGAQMHDVGKIGVPDRILTKPGRLTPEETQIMRRHVGSGFEIAQTVPALRPVADTIRYHHERYDGAGYPEGLSAEQIPLTARIVSVADAFDAMTSGRVYQPAISRPEALAELRRCSGSQFDPRCVAAFAAAAARVRDQAPGVPGPRRERLAGTTSAA